MSELLEKQWRFSRMVAQLVARANLLGFEVSLGEVYRSPEEAARQAKTGKGVKTSLHCDKLAVDLALFRKGVYLSQSDEYADLGAWWESIGGAWGGRFGDGNHFSLSHGGRR